jgi:transposase
MQSAETTKQNLKTVRELLMSLVAEDRTEEAIEVAMAALAKLQHHNTELMLKLHQLQRERSRRRSEKIDPAQLSLMLELCSEEAEEELESLDHDHGSEEDDAKPSPRRPRRLRPAKELPRDVFRYELDPKDRECEKCAIEMPKIGEDVSETVELVPAHFRVQEHRRAKYACPRCKETVKTAPGPVKLIEKGLPGAGLLAHVIQSKYEDAVPLNRLSKIYERGGAKVAVSTMCDWVGKAADELKPIVDRIWEQVLVSHVVQTDGSGLKVLDRKDSEKIRLGTMWCYVGDRKRVVFRYSRTGSGQDGPWTHLAGREGYIQADAASVFDRLYNGDRAAATEIGCLAHARRKFFKLADSDVRVAYPLKLIGRLYKVESNAERAGLSDKERMRYRGQRSKEILKKLQRWLVKTAEEEPPESALAKACAYSLNHWKALTRFLEDGDIELDNNGCERQIRSLAIGRKNYLFAGSDAGADRAATLYSIVRTCDMYDVDPYHYLIDVLGKLAAGWKASRIDELLPEHWAVHRAAREKKPALQATG